MYFFHHHVIDWDKVKDIQDIKLLLAAMQVSFEPTCPHLDKIEHLTKEQPKTDSQPWPSPPPPALLPLSESVEAALRQLEEIREAAKTYREAMADLRNPFEEKERFIEKVLKTLDGA